MRIALLLVALFFASPLDVRAAEPTLPYKVGVASVDITPDHPIRLNGFGFRRAESEGVYQKIHAKALAIEDSGRSPVVIMTVDVLGIPADIYDEVARRLEKKAGLKKDRLAITATHTHTGPMLSGANATLFGTPIPKDHLANIDKYTPVFIDKLEAAALAALQDRKPAKLEWGVGKATFAMNRRGKKDRFDHDLPVLFVKDEKGAVRAVYLAYACHCVTLSHNKIGGDWAGFAGAAIEEQFPNCVALIAIGGGADQNPNSGVTGDKVEIATAQGRELAAEVKRLARNFLAPVTGSITASVTTLELPLAALPTRAQWEQKGKRMDAIGHHARVTLARLDKGDKLPTKIDYPVQTWAFGDSLAMVHLPGELVVDYPLRLKRELDSHRLWVTGYANNAPCYIPSERVLKEGGYEGGGAMIYYDQPAPFAPGLEDKIVDAVKVQIGKSFAATIDPKKTGDRVPLSPQQSQALIRTRPGLQVDLVAAEPLVADPVAIAFGPDGKLWVAEMADYPSGKTGNFEPGGRIVFLEEVDSDGFADKSTVFLDEIPFPTGVLPWRNGVLICAAPDIIFAEDTNGDGRADKVEKLYSGFGTENYQARVNSLQYGLDGWVYGACGLAGGTIRCHKTGKTVALGNRDFRIKPDTGELEPASGATQQGRVRDDRGNWFGCDNTHLVRHYVLEDHYLRRNPHVTYPNVGVNLTTGQTVFPMRRDAQRFALSGPPGNVTAACGLGIYRDTLLGPDFSGNAFTCEPVELLVTRRILKPKGSTFTAERAPDESATEFLASTDGWFRPVHATTGPDGGLWIADMYRYLIEHPRWIPPSDLAHIDTRAGAGLGRIYRVRPADKPLRPWLRLDRLDTPGLVAALDTPNGWQRDMAMMMLVWKNDRAAKEQLEKLFKESKSGLTRMQVLCTLGCVGEVDKKLATKALEDLEAGVRQHAIRVLEPHFASLGSQSLFRLVRDEDPAARLQFASSLGYWPHPSCGELMSNLLREHHGDGYLLAGLLSSVNARNPTSFDMAEVLSHANFTPPMALIRGLLASAAGIENGKYLSSMYEHLLRPNINDDSVRPWQLAGAAASLDALERQGKRWDKLSDTVRFRLNPLLGLAQSLCDKPGASEKELLDAIPLLGRIPATRADDLKRLAGLLAATRPAAVQSAAITALARIPDEDVPGTLVGAFSGASPAVRSRIVDSLLNRPAWQGVLLTAIETGQVPAGQIDTARRQRLLGASDPAIRQKAEKLFAGGNADRQKVIEDYKAVLSLTGDTTRGKAVFAKSCAACHVLDGVGHAVGPDLAALINKSPSYLLSEILDPSRNLDSRYSEYQALTKDERTISGILAAENASGITLRGQQGKDETILRADLQSLRGTAKSLMPEGLEKEVSKQDAADLIAYLTAREGVPKKLIGNAPVEVTVSDNRLTLPATKCFIYGNDLTLEHQFQNIGYWHGEHDHVVWKVRLEQPAEFDVYLDYACADDSAGNRFVLDGVDPVIRGKIEGTSAWDRYSLIKLGTIKLMAGPGRITFRPDGPVKNALLDLRTLYLVPVGAQPNTPKQEAPKDPAELAKQILREDLARPAREELVKQAVSHAPDVIRAMTADLPANDAKEEYRRIPWIWRVAIAASRKDDAKVVAGLVDLSLPRKNEPLRDWQVVVLGGGVINGLSLEGKWPGRRLQELMRDQAELKNRWEETLKLSHAMADNEKVTDGTRYDALRIVALDDWTRAEPRLARYLAKTANAELQQGAVSGLVDVEDPAAVALLLKSVPDLTPGNRKFAIGGMLRTPARARALLDAVAAGTIRPDWVDKQSWDALLKHEDEEVRSRAGKVIKK